jgi:hypothetical protein
MDKDAFGKSNNDYDSFVLFSIYQKYKSSYFCLNIRWKLVATMWKRKNSWIENLNKTYLNPQNGGAG